MFTGRARGVLVGVVLAVLVGPLVGCAEDPSDVPVAVTEATQASATTVPASDELDRLEVVDHRGTEQVDVRALDNVFVDAAIRVDVGATVTWRNEGRSAHTVNDGGNTAPPPGLESTALPVGGEHAVTFDEPGTYAYFCELHGTAERGMVGVVVVGDGEAPAVTTTTEGEPPPTSSASEEEADVIRVPADAATIQEAVDRADPGALVLIAPGTYHEAVVVTRDDIVIRGEDRNTVILDGGYELDNGIEVLEADGVAIENLTVTSYTTNGLFWTGVDGYRASYVTSINNGYYGIYAFDSTTGIFEHSYASGSADSGFYVGQCKPCDAVVTDVIGEYNNFGFAGANTKGVTIENSTWRHNRGGMIIASLDNELLAPQEGDIVRNNVVEASGDGSATQPKNPDLDALYGIGIAIVGGLDNVVEGNTVSGSVKIGIAVTPNPAIQVNFWPAERNQVLDNTVSDSGEYDLGIAAVPDMGDNCFEGNTFTTSGPQSIEQAAPCSGDPTADPTIGAPDLASYLDTSENPPGVEYQTQRTPGPQPVMPNALTAPAEPASLLRTGR